MIDPVDYLITVEASVEAPELHTKKEMIKNPCCVYESSLGCLST